MVSTNRPGGVAAGFLACALALPVLAQQAGPGPQAPPGSPHPVRSPGNAEWALSVGDARARAAAEKKLVYFEFDSDGCGNCRRMQSLLYSAFDFEALLIGMVPVKLRTDSEEAKPLQQRYGIKDVPAVLITTPEGRLVFMMQGFRDAPDFYSHAGADLASYRQFVKKLGQPVDALSGKEALAIGRELYERSDPLAATPYLERAATAPRPEPGVREQALERLAAAQFDAGNTAAARQSIDRLLAITKSPEQKERAELFRAQIPLYENKPAEALAFYKKFAKEHPGSPYLERVQSFIARLEPATAAKP